MRAVNLKTSRPLKDWRMPEGWWCREMQSSAEGTWVGIYLDEDYSASDHDWQIKRANFGLLRADQDADEKITWVTLSGAKGQNIAGDIRSVMPSDDGRYIAVGGWNNGVALLDMASGAAVWTNKPYEEASLPYVVFSADSRVVYAGGTSGAVYAINVATGQVLSKWFASSSGKEEGGHRISCLAASPDGRWVAAGTGPEGLVYVGATATNRPAAVLNHGGSTVLLVSFSPDSTALATFVPGTLKVWKVAQWSKQDK